jgi:hypothetical protein
VLFTTAVHFSNAGKVIKLLREAQVIESLSEIGSMALMGSLSFKFVHRQFVQAFRAVG